MKKNIRRNFTHKDPEDPGMDALEIMVVTPCETAKPPPGTPRPTIYKWMFQLDDEPNLFVENGWKSPFPSIYIMVGLGVPGTQFSIGKNHPIKLTVSFGQDQVSKAGETACLSLLSNLRFAAKLEEKVTYVSNKTSDPI